MSKVSRIWSINSVQSGVKEERQSWRVYASHLQKEYRLVALSKRRQIADRVQPQMAMKQKPGKQNNDRQKLVITFISASKSSQKCVALSFLSNSVKFTFFSFCTSTRLEGLMQSAVRRRGKPYQLKRLNFEKLLNDVKNGNKASSKFHELNGRIHSLLRALMQCSTDIFTVFQ